MAKQKQAGQTVRDRLAILVRGEKPYTWARNVGIEKGLFQYYWQKGKVPTYHNLLKIQKATGCSLDWFLTGRTVDPERIEGLEFRAVEDEDMNNLRRVISQAGRDLAQAGQKRKLMTLAEVAQDLAELRG